MTASDGQNGDKRAGTGEGGAAGTGGEAPALVIIEAFGGIRPMAKHLGLAVSTVQGWKERSAIPANRHDEIRTAARNHNIAIDSAVLRASASDDGVPPPVIEGQAAAVGMSAASAAAKPRDVKDQAKPHASKDPAKPRDVKESAKPRDSKDQSMPQDSKDQLKPAMLPPRPRGAPAPSCRAWCAVSCWRSVWPPARSTPRPTGRRSWVSARRAARRTARWRASRQKWRSSTRASANCRAGSRRTIPQPWPASASAWRPWRQPSPRGGGQDPDTRAALESLNGQLARLSDRIEAQDQDLAELRGRATQPSEDVVIQLSGEAARLDQMLSTQSELAKRLTEAEAALTAAAASRETAPGSRETLLLLAALQLRDAIQGSGPYDQPLKMLQNLAGDDAALAAALAPLERRAGSGLPSLRDLQASFPPVARRIAAIEVGQEGEGWTAGVLRRLSEAVNLRPVGLVEGTAPTAVAARAEVKLNDGDLAGALAELDVLEGAAAEASAAWRAEAEARLAADRAVSTLGALVSERFAPLAGG